MLVHLNLSVVVSAGTCWHMLWCPSIVYIRPSSSPDPISPAVCMMHPKSSVVSLLSNTHLVVHLVLQVGAQWWAGVTCGGPALGSLTVTPLPSLPPHIHTTTPPLNPPTALLHLIICIGCNYNMYYFATPSSFKPSVTPEPPSLVPPARALMALLSDPSSAPWSQWHHAELWSHAAHMELS